jgi:hypothetical protein
VVVVVVVVVVCMGGLWQSGCAQRVWEKNNCPAPPQNIMVGRKLWGWVPQNIKNAKQK